MISYLGFPLIWPDNQVFGTVCVLDNKTNTYSSEYIVLVQQFSEIIIDDLKLLTERARRQQAEEDLLKSESRLQSLLESQSAFVMRTDMNGEYTYVNPAFVSWYGWKREKLLSESVLDHVDLV